MEDPPTPLSYNICPCCSCEFGVNDADATHEELRQEWIRSGAEFWENGGAPDGWSAVEQLRRAGFMPVAPAPEPA